MKKKFPKGRGGATQLAENMQVDKVLIKTALLVEKRIPEFIPLICEGALTIREAIMVQKTWKENSIVEDELAKPAGKALKYIRKVFGEKDFVNAMKDEDKIIALWKLKKSIGELAKIESMK